MKKEQLLEKIQALPPGVEVCIYDWRRNQEEDSGEGTSAGLYTDFEVAMMEGEDIVEGCEPFAVLGFENPYVGDEDEEGGNPPGFTRSCRVCGCTDYDCRQCIQASGNPCTWVEWDLCSRCRMEEEDTLMAELLTFVLRIYSGMDFRADNTAIIDLVKAFRQMEHIPADPAQDPQEIHHGLNIKRFRDLLQMKQHTFAESLGEPWTQKKVSQLEAMAEVDDQTLAKVSAALGVSADAIKAFNVQAFLQFIQKDPSK